MGPCIFCGIGNQQDEISNSHLCASNQLHYAYFILKISWSKLILKTKGEMMTHYTIFINLEYSKF